LSGFLSPPDTKNLQGLWWSPRIISKPVESPEKLAQKSADDHRAALARQAQSDERLERRKQVESHNVFIEQLKKNVEENRVIAQNREAQGEAEKELRKQKAMDALKNPSAAATEPEKKP
jgi:hypothetical protein